MQLISKVNKGFRSLLFIIDIYGKYAWVGLLKTKKGMAITNAFQKILDESSCKRNKKWVDNGSEFCNRSIKSWLQDNELEIYSTHEGKSIKEKFYKNIKEQNL